MLALSLSLPVDLPYWWTIQSIAFGVVIFTLFVQAPLIDPLLRHFKNDKAAKKASRAPARVRVRQWMGGASAPPGRKRRQDLS